MNEISLVDSAFYELLSTLDTELGTKYSILFHRLLHPSGMVKERTCASIAKLLLHDDFSSVTTTLLYQWIISQKLEIQAVYGLLAFIRARLFDDSYEFIDLTSIFKKMRSPSLLGIDLYNEVFPPYALSSLSKIMHSTTYPRSYEIDSFFQNNEAYFVSPSLRYIIRENREVNPLKMIKQWSFESDLYIKELGYTPNSDVLRYGGRPDLDHHTSFSTILHDIYTSAYLRAISWAKSCGLSLENARRMLIQTCPINLGLWKINPSPKPLFWPTIDTVSASPVENIWIPLSELWKSQLKQNQVLGFINGRVGNTESFYDLAVFAFFENIDVEPRLSDEVLFSLLSNHYVPNETLSYSCDGEIIPNDIDDLKTVSSLGIIPLSGMFFTGLKPRWQFWRLHRQLHFPSVHLIQTPIKYSCFSDGIHFTEQGKLVAKWSDWTDGVTEKREANLSLRTGNKLEISKIKLRSLLIDNQLKYGWLCRITEYSKKNSLTYDIKKYYKKYI